MAVWFCNPKLFAPYLFVTPMKKVTLAIKYKPLASLVPYANNARTHSEKQVKEIAASIRQFGFTTPIALDGKHGVLAGHGRIMGATLYNSEAAAYNKTADGKKNPLPIYDTLPTIELSHLDDRQKRAYILADNKIAMNSGWDWEKLSKEMADLAAMDYDIDELGFSDHEIDALLKDDQSILGDYDFSEPRADVKPSDKAEPGAGGTVTVTEAHQEGEPVEVSAEVMRENFLPELVGEPKSKPGDVWILGEHMLICGDSRKPEVLAALNHDKRVDIVMSDPPYGVDIVMSDPPYGVDIVKAKKGTDKGKIGSGGAGPASMMYGTGKNIPAKSYYPVAGDGDTETARLFYEACIKADIKNYILFGGNYFTGFLPPSPCWLVWDKMNTGEFADVEMCWTSYPGAAKLYHFMWNGMIREGERKDELISRIHPTQKPVGLLCDMMQDFPFEVCVDGFGGSGSTLIACEKLARTCRMAEMIPYYCDMIILRYQQYSGKIAVNQLTGLAYGEEG